MSEPVLLLTGFEPFAGDPLNPSWEVARALDGERIGAGRVRALQLPCVFGASLDLLGTALRRHRPVVVLCLGLAAGRAEVSIERVAVNLDDARIPDNAGAQPRDQPVVAGGPAAYFARLPVKAMAQGLRQAGLPGGLSHSAGSFVCNHVFYGLLHRLRRQPAVRAGFVHLPLLPELRQGPQDARPVLALVQQVEAVRHLLAIAQQAGPDLAAPGGEIA